MNIIVYQGDDGEALICTVDNEKKMLKEYFGPKSLRWLGNYLRTVSGGTIKINAKSTIFYEKVLEARGA